MRLLIAVVASICGLAAAHPKADGYLFRSGSPTEHDVSTPELPRQLTRLILQQRLGVDKHFSSLKELSSLPNTEDAISYINTLGRSEVPLFSESDSETPSQLLIIIEGLEDGDMKDILPGVKKTFAIDVAPNSAAIRKLIDGEFGAVGVRQSSCEFGRAINPLDENCWSGQSSIIRYDAKKHAGIIEAVQKAAPKLQRYAETGEMETAILVFPESSRKSKTSSWSSYPSELHRRQAEAVLSSEGPFLASSQTPKAKSPVASNSPGNVERGAIPACFKSWSGCVNATNSCSGHGFCVNKWSNDIPEDGSEPPKTDGAACFVCSCKRTLNEKNHTTSWGGATCEKIDVSTPFALFVGFTIIMVTVIAGGITMLYSIGNEPLPGVLGAGVAKR